MAAEEERTELARVVKNSVHRMLGEESKKAFRALDLTVKKIDKRGQRVTAHFFGRDFWLVTDDVLPDLGPAPLLHLARNKLAVLLAAHDTVAQNIARLRELGAVDDGLWNTWINHHGEALLRLKRGLQRIDLAAVNNAAATEPIAVAWTLPHGSPDYVERMTAARDHLQWASAFGDRAHNEVRLLRRALVREFFVVRG